MRLSPLLIIVAAGIVTGCTVQQPPGAGLQVSVTIYPLAYIAEQIGGDGVEVMQLVPPGTEAHAFEPRPQDIAALHASDLFIMNGAGMNAWAEKVAPELTAKGVRVVIATDGIDLLTLEEEEEGPEASDVHRRVDPHVWLDPIRMQATADRIAQEFIAADPEHEHDYRLRADALRKQLADLDQRFQEGLAACEIRDIITAHHAFGYLAARYNLQAHAAAGLSPEEEPSPRALAELTAIAEEHDVRVIFLEKLSNPRIAETIAEEVGAETSILHPLESLTPEEKTAGVTYFSAMEENLARLRYALRCQ